MFKISHADDKATTILTGQNLTAQAKGGSVGCLGVAFKGLKVGYLLQTSVTVIIFSWKAKQLPSMSPSLQTTKKKALCCGCEEKVGTLSTCHEK